MQKKEKKKEKILNTLEVDKDKSIKGKITYTNV